MGTQIHLPEPDDFSQLALSPDRTGGNGDTAMSNMQSNATVNQEIDKAACFEKVAAELASIIERN
jgi:hypothetical protein